jgi:hypothetical protein
MAWYTVGVADVTMPEAPANLPGVTHQHARGVPQVPQARFHSVRAIHTIRASHAPSGAMQATVILLTLRLIASSAQPGSPAPEPTR